MSKSVYLSPSTQEGNIGVAGYGTEEQRMNQVCDITQRVLKAHGLVTYRNKPEMTLKELVADSNAKKPDIHLAIHSNAAGSANAGRARGAEVYCYRFGGEGERLARAVYQRLSAITPTADRGVKESHSHFGPGKPLYETAYTVAPAALVEVAFHDNPDDARWIMENIALIGTELARGVLDFFGMAYLEEQPQAVEQPGTGIAVGTVVEFLKEAIVYYPNGPTIPGWVKEDFRHVVTSDLYKGMPVLKGGKRCVLLGKKILRATNAESAGINTWAAQENLRPVSGAYGPEKRFFIRVGAFTQRAAAEAVLGKLKAAGFDGVIKEESP
jgi:N-acetylmuramoyl-L-alanine amidase